ncbi:hypothetical protein H6S29_25190 (plasmid) [Escherichia coli]|nr:hypothetical protein H6S29_25190 [Escherichia coli]
MPLFPGYVFIKIDFNKTHSTTVTSVPWVKSFVSFGGEPVPVCEEIILGLRRRETNYWGNILLYAEYLMNWLKSC